MLVILWKLNWSLLLCIKFSSYKQSAHSRECTHCCHHHAGKTCKHHQSRSWLWSDDTVEVFVVKFLLLLCVILLGRTQTLFLLTRARMIPLTLESILEGILDEEMTTTSSSSSPVMGSSSSSSASMSNVDGSFSPSPSGSPPQVAAGETFSVVLDHHDIRASCHLEPIHYILKSKYECGIILPVEYVEKWTFSLKKEKLFEITFLTLSKHTLYGYWYDISI